MNCLNRLGLVALLGVPALARLEVQTCGTHPETAREALFLHRQSAVKGTRRLGLRQAPVARPSDIGEIALIDDSNGVVTRSNPFDLNRKLLRFTPTTAMVATYRYEIG